MLRYLWAKITSTGRPATPRQRATTRWRSLPRVELLEGRCLPSTVLAEFPVLTAGSYPAGITTGPDGNIWFTEESANKIGEINPTTHAVSEFLIPTVDSGPMAIAAGSNGNLWFTEFTGNRIGEINPISHVITEFALPSAGSGPMGITAGPDGNIWFTEYTAGGIGVINPNTGLINQLAPPTPHSGPEAITAGPDGNIWFTETSSDNIGMVNLALYAISEFAVPLAGSQPYGITARPDGNLWFVESGGNQVAGINAATHVFVEFPIPTATSGPVGIAAAADGNIWFTESTGDQVGELNLSTGLITETPMPAPGASPRGMTTGPGGTLWFTAAGQNEIGEVLTSPVVTMSPVSQTTLEGRTVTLTAAAVGLPRPAVQWEVSIDGGVTFTPLANDSTYHGVKNGTLTITGVTTAMNGYRYEAVFTNGTFANSAVATSAAVLTVKPVLSVTPKFPDGIAGAGYDQTVHVVGSKSPFTVFTVTSFLPGGTGLTADDVTIDPDNRAITVRGTPTAVGTATFTINVADTAGYTLTQTLSITIRPPLAIATPSLPAGTADWNYTQTISVVGGIVPYAAFKVINFQAGTTGLTQSAIVGHPASGSFTINGMPTAAGTASFTAEVIDAAGTTVSQAFTIVINPPLAITPTLRGGTAGVSYDQTVTITGGGQPYTTLTVSRFHGGTTGLTMADVTTDVTARTVTITGTPTAAGTATFTVSVVDAVGAVLTRTFTLTIHSALSITPALPQGTAGTGYRHTIQIAGGAAPYPTVTLTGFSDGGTGLTAAAFTINAAAGTVTVHGTPTAAGTASFTVNVTDSLGNHLSQPFSIVINPAPTLGSLSTPQWTVGLAGFTGVSNISGGTGPFRLTGVTGLPVGISAVLTGNTIRFTGTPPATGAFAVHVTVADAAGASVAATFPITINAAPTIGKLTIRQWTEGVPGFPGTLTAVGGTGGLTLTNSAGLPTGLTAVLTGNQIRFVGTPTAVGTFAASVTLRDAVGAHVTRAFSIQIHALLSIGDLTTTIWITGKSAFPGTLTIAGGTGPFVLTEATGLPPGVTAVVTGNQIHFLGNPTQVKTFSDGSVTVRDASGATATKLFSITIDPPV